VYSHLYRLTENDHIWQGDPWGEAYFYRASLRRLPESGEAVADSRFAGFSLGVPCGWPFVRCAGYYWHLWVRIVTETLFGEPLGFSKLWTWEASPHESWPPWGTSLYRVVIDIASDDIANSVSVSWHALSVYIRNVGTRWSWELITLSPYINDTPLSGTP